MGTYLINNYLYRWTFGEMKSRQEARVYVMHVLFNSSKI